MRCGGCVPRSEIGSLRRVMSGSGSTLGMGTWRVDRGIGL